MDLASYQDQLSIDTPEHVSLRLPVAGVGSRFLAIMVDTLIQIVAYLLFLLAFALMLSGVHTASTAPASPSVMAWTTAILIFLHFLAYWGYFTLFEGFWHGQTPGKRLFKLRVIKDTGRQIGFVESMARNLLRIVDALPGMYLVGILAVLFHPQRKRLGDMVAASLVVHAEELADPSSLTDASRTFTAGLFAPSAPDPTQAEQSTSFPASAIARLGSGDQVLLDTFFARIPELDVDTKEAIEQRILSTLCAKMGVAPPDGPSRRALLDFIACELRNQAGLRFSSTYREG
jgi:uncharacterized RDD family membrane protein YckC